MNILLTTWAVIQFSSSFLREAPSYTSECVSQTRMGTLVEVLDHQGYWVKVRTPEPYEGWITDMGLVEIPSETEYLQSSRYICTAEQTHVMSSPSADSDRICDFLMGNMIGKGASVKGPWVEVVLPSSEKGWVRASEVADFRRWADSRNATAEKIIAMARRFRGVPYMWGGMSVKHFDCSGLAGFCYFMNGLLLPRDARDQVKCGIEVPVDEMRPGDLVFFGEKRIAHVGLCTGGKNIIHSSMLVRENSLEPGSERYYSRNILHVRRILGHEDAGEIKVVRIADSPLYFK